MNEILPLAVTMMVGPQIITSIILVTSKQAVSNSLSYIAGIALAVTSGTLVLAVLANLFGWSSPDNSEPTRFAIALQTVLIVLLIGLTIKTYMHRKTAKLPAWMSSLQETNPKKVFKIACTLIFLMPTDILVMLVVGINLSSNSQSTIKLVPLVALTTFIAAIPLLAYLAFGKKAAKAMPKARTWMDKNSWVVSIVAYLLFIWLIWS